MIFLTLLFSPMSLLFFVIVIGLALGKIRIKNISLGVAGILFIAIVVGVFSRLLLESKSTEIIHEASNYMNVFSKLGTSIFVSVIGLQTGFSIKNNSKTSIVAFTIGASMSISGVLTMLLISILDNKISYPSLLGILCGALTSTPGLSSVCELIDTGSEQVVLSYGCSYILGVIIVVFFAHSFSEKNNPKTNYTSDNRQSNTFIELIVICMVALLGNVLGTLRIPPSSISLGTTASTLLIGLLIGFIINKTSLSKRLSPQGLNVFKNLGLALFLASTGFTTGIRVESLDIKTTLYGVIITLSAILCGWLSCQTLFKKYNLHCGFIIAGGMTSSPAYASICSNFPPKSTNCFSFSYFGALISLIIAIQFIC